MPKNKSEKIQGSGIPGDLAPHADCKKGQRVMTEEQVRHVAVWEWRRRRGEWIPYSSGISCLLEHASCKKLNLVRLGDIDPVLASFVVHMKDSKQVSDDTGTERLVRRNIYPASSAAGQGVLWQYRGDGMSDWCNYAMSMIVIIEEAYQKGAELVDLSPLCTGWAGYTVDVRRMTQRNNGTSFLRPVRRIAASPYPSAKTVTIARSAESSPNSRVCTNGQPSNDGTPTKTHSKPISTDASAGPQNKHADSKTSSTLEVGVASHQLGTKRQAPELTFWNPVAMPPFLQPSLFRPVQGVAHPKKSQKKLPRTNKSVKSVLSQFTEEIQPSELEEADQECTICLEKLTERSAYDKSTKSVAFRLCTHCFHRSCLKAMYDSGTKDGHLQCPTCKTIYGIKKGNQPPGNMDFYTHPSSLPGYPGCGTICIVYNILPGIQGPEHPQPGKPYAARGFPRRCYLPDNEKGRKVLRLLVLAWERQLIFTIGRSATTGEDCTVTWNEIHHKTEFGTNFTGHGYPDPHYLDNVLMELALQGVMEE